MKVKRSAERGHWRKYVARTDTRGEREEWGKAVERGAMPCPPPPPPKLRHPLPPPPPQKKKSMRQICPHLPSTAVQGAGLQAAGQTQRGETEIRMADSGVRHITDPQTPRACLYMISSITSSSSLAWRGMGREKDEGWSILSIDQCRRL